MSDAVGSERVAKIVGYRITKGDFKKANPNLPIRIAVLGEANEANQSTLDLNPKVITSAQQAGQLYGFGSPIHMMMRILRPVNGGGVQAIPTIVYPQSKAAGAVAKVLQITPTGTATANGTHTAVIAGRTGVDGATYDFEVKTGDTPTEIIAKIRDAVNAVLSTPVIASVITGKTVLTSKWNGLTSDKLSVTINTNGNSLGITYAVVSSVSGSGTPSVQAALNLFGSEWNTHVVNGYGMDTSTMTLLEAFNGIPDVDNPTGRYQGIVMKPFIALTGSVEDDSSSVTDTRSTQVTIAICPAPLSAGLPLEAAANMCVLAARQAQDTPHTDVAGMSYPDMPTPINIGSMASYDNRDTIVQKGHSTVDLISQRYVVQDFVTTYHPVGENPPQFRYVRSLIQDFNIRFGYYLLEQTHVVGHSIASDDAVVSVSKVVKPKQWLQIIRNYAEELEKKNLIVDKAFMQESTTVDLDGVNPDRFNSFFRYKRSGFARISSTTAEAGFNFGSLN